MNLFWRLLWRWVTARYRDPCGILELCTTRFRVWWTDLDVLRHVNNGVYLSLCDLARLDLMRRAGLWRKLRAERFYPVVAAETVVFHRSLHLGDVFRIETQILGWNEKVFFIRHEFRRDAELVMSAVVSARFLRRSGGGISPPAVLALVSVRADSPPLPSWVEIWHAATVALRDHSQPAGREVGG